MARAAEKSVAPGIDIDAYRERVAEAVDIAIDELIAANRDDQNAVVKRMVAVFLLSKDQLPVGDIARIVEKSESWVRTSKDYVERRISQYYAFSVYIERTLAAYSLSSLRTEVKGKAVAGGIDIDGYRDRVAGAVGIAVSELVAHNDVNSDAEMTQRVAAYLVVARDELSIGDVARIMNQSEQWVSYAKDYIQRRMKRSRELRVYVESNDASYALASASAKVAAS